MIEYIYTKLILRKEENDYEKENFSIVMCRLNAS